MSPKRSAAANAVDERFEQHEIRLAEFGENLEHSQRELRNALQDVFDQVMEKLETMEASVTCPLGENSQVNTIPDPVNALVRWPWVDKTIIQSAANSEFDINSLPKLYRDGAPRTRYT